MLIKKVNNNKKYVLGDAIPYLGAKPMYLVNVAESIEKLKEIVIDTCECLKK